MRRTLDPFPFLRSLLLALVALAGTTAPGAAEAPPNGGAVRPELVILSWDGAGDEIVDRMRAEGRMPHLAALAARGAEAAWSVTSFPSKTATAHATLWTGCSPDDHGVTANSTPVADLEALAELGPEALWTRRSGFSSASLAAEPLYVTAARAGRKVVVLSATQSYPEDVHVDALRAAGLPTEPAAFAGRYRSVSGFEHQIAPARRLGPADLATASPPAAGGTAWGFAAGELSAAAREIEIKVGETSVFLLVFGVPSEASGTSGLGTSGLDRVLVRVGSRAPVGRPGGATAEALLRPRPAGPLVPGDWRERLVPDGWSPPLPVAGMTEGDPSRIRGPERRTGNVFFRLFALSSDGSKFALYQRAVHALDGAITDEDLTGYLTAYPGFHDAGFDVYSLGARDAAPDGSAGLGHPIPLGGDGTAEERLLEIIDLDYRFLASGTLWALDTWKPDLLWHYSPSTDSAGHAWYGLLHRKGSGYDPEIAERLWPYYARIFTLADRWLGEIVAAVPETSGTSHEVSGTPSEVSGTLNAEASGTSAGGTIVAVTSDHGMAGVTRSLQVNRLLSEAGLLAWGDDGRPDLARTTILAPAFGDGFFLVVNDERFGGPVEASEREEVLTAATAALLGARDPEGPGGPDAPVVERVFRPERLPGLGIGGPRGGDLYFDLAPGYYPRNVDAPTPFVPERSPWGTTGQHGFWPERRDMHAIFYTAGPGIAPGTELPPIRHIDVAPTLAQLLELPRPPCAEGVAVKVD